MKYIKLFENHSNDMDIYGNYSIANSYTPDIIKTLEDNNIHFKYDENLNCINLEFCGSFVGDDKVKETLLNIINEMKCIRKDWSDSKDDSLIIMPMKFY